MVAVPGHATPRPVRPVAARRSSADAPWAEAIAHILAAPGQPQLVFQPIVDLARGVVVGFEALARFHGLRLAPPDVWFAEAAALGVAAELEGRVLTAAIAARRTLPPDCFLTVNLSPALLRHPYIVGLLLAEPDLRRLVIELTEHVAYQADGDLRVLMGRLREAGAMFAIDDAGAGYSGLAQIAAVRPELVKLDRSLVDGAAHDEVKLALARLLGEYCGRLDSWLLGEGVEEHDDLAALMRLGVPLAQGYLLGRPGPDWNTTLSPEVLRTLDQARLAATAPGIVAALVDRVPILAAGELPRHGYAVLLDGHGRARSVHTVARQTPLVWRTVPVSLSVAWNTAVADIASRLLLRPDACRFDPIVCNDAAGRPIGLVRVERILEHLSIQGGT